MVVKRNRTPSKYVGYGLYLYFLGLSYRNTSKALSRFVKRSHVSIWKWIQKYRPKRIKRKRKRTTEFIIDETMIKSGSNYMWIWVAIEPESKEILGISVSKERNMLIAEHFISSLTKRI
jgi:putative transposase